MVFLANKFRGTASRLQVLSLGDADFTPDKLLSLAKEYMPSRVRKAISKDLDLEDPFILWELFAIDAVISLENIEGELIRVGISVVEDQGKGNNLLRQGKQHSRMKLRHALGIEYYWVIVVKWKYFPDDEQWIDIFYQEIDIPPNNPGGCRLLVV